MASCIAILLLGLLSVVSAQTQFENDALKNQADLIGVFMDAIQCLDGSCDFDDFLEQDMLSSKLKSVIPTPVKKQPKISIPQIEKDSSDLQLCMKLLEKKKQLKENPQFQALESCFMSYFNEMLSTIKKDPSKKEEIIFKVLTDIIEKLEKLKVIIANKKSKKQPIVPTEEIIAEVDDDFPMVGSLRGIPGVHYPNYTEIPITSFTCGDKKYVPGFYADKETRCQVFHVCYEHRRESFLCPIGTIFNQPILACDYWYSSNCSLSPHYYDINVKKIEDVKLPGKEDIKDLITSLIEQEKPALPPMKVKKDFFKDELEQLMKFLPIKAKILDFPKKMPVVAPVKPVIVSVKPKIAVPVVVPFKPKIAVPVAKLAIPVKAKAAVPMMKAKVAAAGIPVMKAKVAAAAGIPMMKAKVAAAGIPMMKAMKAVPAKAAALPLLKTKAAAKAIPLMAKAAVKPKLASIPLKAKAAMVAKPVLKAKSLMMISPLTKKALALGYVKLLKAKKLGLMG